MAERMLITGAGGFLGSRLLRYFEKRGVFEVIGVTHRELDLGDSLAVSAFMRAARPQVVLHCAAISQTGRCEENPLLSRRVNVEGCANIARACRDTGSRLIFMSSDQIYSGAGGLEPFREGGESRPGNVYGRDKKRAEEQMFSILKEGVALRLSWMYDFPGSERNSGLLEALYQTAKRRESFLAPVCDYRGLTYVWDVVRNMERALRLPGGVYNFGSAGCGNFFETASAFGEAVEEVFGLSCQVEADRERFALAPRNLMMNMEKAASCGICFPDTLAGLAGCLNENRGMWEQKMRLGAPKEQYGTF